MDKPEALRLADVLDERRVTRWVHSTGDTPRAAGHAVDVECAQAAAELRRQHAEIERLREDAERYRWLRQRYPALTTMQAARGVGLDLSRTFVNTAEKFDAAIDAALKETK